MERGGIANGKIRGGEPMLELWLLNQRPAVLKLLLDHGGDIKTGVLCKHEPIWSSKMSQQRKSMQN